MGIIAPPASPAIIRKLQQRRQVIATRGQIMGPTSTNTGANAGDGGGGTNNYTRGDSRIRVKLARARFCDVSLVYSNFKAYNGDVANANAITLDACAIESGSLFQAGMFGNGVSLSAMMLAGAPFVQSDPFPNDYDASAAQRDILIRTGVKVASAGLTWPRGGLIGLPSEGSVDSNNAASQAYGTGLLSATGGLTSNFAHQPLAVLGVADRPIRSFIIVGDSIPRGAGETTTIGVEMGYPARGLVNAAGGPLPYVNVSRDGESASAYQTQYMIWRLMIARYCTDALSELGTNDGASGQTAAQAFTNLQIGWQRLRNLGVSRVYQTLILPRVGGSGGGTLSTDSYATAAGQTPIPGFEAGGAYRDPLNALIRNAANTGRIDGFIDPNPYVEDPNNPGKWLTNGTANYPTTDGVHPSSTFHALAAQAVTDFVNSRG